MATTAAQQGICGLTRNSPRFEWVCIAPVHDDGQHSHHLDQRGHHPRSERHLFVRRYPGTDH